MDTDSEKDFEGTTSEPPKNYEERDANSAWIFGLVLILGVCLAIIHFVLSGTLNRLERRPAPADRYGRVEGMPTIRQARPPFPRLQISPAEDLKAFREREEAKLTSYGWVDKENGIVRIPIERAMGLLLERGLPVRSNSNANATGPSSYQLELQRASNSTPDRPGDR